jgi:hypothetical protein
MSGQGIATPLAPPVGGVENVPQKLIRLLRENREALGPVWADMAIAFVQERAAFGKRKYSQELHTFDGRSPHLDALQELIDLMQYLHKAELEHAALVAENAGLRKKAQKQEASGPSRYPITDDAAARIDRAFTYHPPKGDEQVDRYTRLRSLYRELAKAVVEMTPPGREQALAMTALEESSMWGNAAIARGE